MGIAGGPKKSSLWKHFTAEGEGSKTQLVATCKYCNQKYANNTVRMAKHILKGCQRIPGVVRELNRLLTGKKDDEIQSDDAAG